MEQTQTQKKKKPDLPLLLCILLAALGVLLLAGGALFGSKKSEAPAAPDEGEYLLALRLRAEALCNSVAGVSEAEALFTCETGFEYRYTAAEKPEVALYPRLNGIAVVCRGGDLPQNQKKIIDLLSAAFGLSAARISVAGKA